ncbi:MAG: redoxin domain-containing protein [Opitutaceae bacterium]|nr:redoxin domain-containing protein [Opitutaceae bacterium]
MKIPSLFAFGCAILATALPAHAQTYRAGDIVQNFTLTDRATGRPVSLADFSGKIVFLEWFAWWCPFCQAAAPQVRSGIVDYYTARGGNPAGVPVLHVALNLQAGQEAQTQQFINAYGVGQTLNDFSRTIANRFQTGGQPIFAIVNGVAGSASHRQWELVFSQLGYGSTQAPITDFRRAIDSVRAAAPTTPPPPPPPPTVAAPAIAASPRDLTVRPGQLAQFFAFNTGGAATHEWRKDGALLPNATGAMLALENVTTADAGRYTVTLANSAGMATATAILVVQAGVESRLVNVATRALAGTGAESLIPGFVIAGGPKTVLVRAAGPALAAFGVADTLADPRLELFSSATAVSANDDWSAAGNAAEVAAASVRTGAFALALGSRDAALLATLQPGAYSVRASGADATAGVALVEIYDADTAGAPGRGSFVNLATRGLVGAGANVMIPGYVISGSAAKTLLIRAAGPALTAFGVAGALPDPVIVLFSGQETLLTNDNWGDATNADLLRAAATRVGAFALAEGSKDAALLVTLPPGAYTVSASGVGGSTGVALVEIYEVP